MIQRVTQLTEAGVIQITAVSDPLQLGFARQAMLGINVEPSLVKQVAESLAAIPEVVYVVITAGGFDILVEVVGESDAHLLELVTAHPPIPGVTSIHTFLYLELREADLHLGRPLAQPMVRIASRDVCSSVVFRRRSSTGGAARRRERQSDARREKQTSGTAGQSERRGPPSD